MKLAFLHLSDLHYRSDRPETVDVVINAVVRDAAGVFPADHVRHLLFSGDAVRSGDDSDSYTSLLTHLGLEMDKLGIPKSRRLIVPGNHDVARHALRGPSLTLRNGAFNAIDDESLFNDSIPFLSGQSLDAQFANYIAFERAFADFGACATVVGGSGWTLQDSLGVYCLNSALCSSAGMTDASGRKVDDRGALMVDTRSINRWLSETKGIPRMLLMHHPPYWLKPWAKSEIESIVDADFRLVVTGHEHGADAFAERRARSGSVRVMAPALFTHKADTLGYSVLTVDTASLDVSIVYRQWVASSRTFVSGTTLSRTDDGSVRFSSSVPVSASASPTSAKDTLSVLQKEFDRDLVSVSSFRIWVERDLADRPETDPTPAIMSTAFDIVDRLRPCVIRAPSAFGLTSLGRFIALEHYKRRNDGSAVVMLDVTSVPNHPQGIRAYLQARCGELGIEGDSVAAVIIDRYQPNKQSRRLIEELRNIYPDAPHILLHGIDDASLIATAVGPPAGETFEHLFLWSLTRASIRMLVTDYLRDRVDIDEALVTAKIVSDIDALNIHRTPLNCLLLLRLASEGFDETPVNRTELIGRVLTLLFYQFDQVPGYATRPDLKDCEYALGSFCEELLREGRSTFSRDEFCTSVRSYCSTRLIELDVDLLFAFLESENILVAKAFRFQFRFAYWLYYFAAHRMHHDPTFAAFVLDNRRYSSHPDLIEFYAGIDRRRSDAVDRLTNDLAEMNSDFLARTGIADDFNLFEVGQWILSDEALSRMHDELEAGIAETTLPSAIKDAIADRSYDRALPYSQQLSSFIESSSIKQLMQASRGAARVLRNSDHVSPERKAALLSEVLRSWQRFSQLLQMLSPLLAAQRSARFEDVLFYLDKGFHEEGDHLWSSILASIPANVVGWYRDDLFSRKMGLLLGNHAQSHPDELSEFFVIMLMIYQRPLGWERHVERFVVRQAKNSFYLHQVFFALDTERRESFANERTRTELRRLSAMSLSKHETGVKHPNVKAIEKAAKKMDRHE